MDRTADAVSHDGIGGKVRCRASTTAAIYVGRHANWDSFANTASLFPSLPLRRRRWGEITAASAAGAAQPVRAV